MTSLGDWRRRLPGTLGGRAAADSPLPQEDDAADRVDENLAITVTERPEGIRVAPVGELDLSNVACLARRIATAEARSPAVLEIDLRGLTFIDSSGLTELFAANRRARERGRRIVLIKDHGPIERVLNLAHVEDVMDVIDQPN